MKQEKKVVKKTPPKKVQSKTPQKKVVSTKKAPIKKTVPKKVVKKTKTRKLRYGRILLVLFILALIIYLFVTFVHFPIRNIFISGNTYLSDQEVIDLVKIRDYPDIFSVTCHDIKKTLEKNIYVSSAKVTKNKLKEINIKITENIPLFYYKSTNRTLFTDGREIDQNIASTVLINYVPDTIYQKLIQKIKSIDPMILKRISILEYNPNNVDTERFLLTMADGNYVYLTLEKFDSINNYIEIMKNIIQANGNQKGILYLDSGEYFEIMK